MPILCLSLPSPDCSSPEPNDSHSFSWVFSSSSPYFEIVCIFLFCGLSALDIISQCPVVVGGNLALLGPFHPLLPIQSPNIVG